MLPLHSLASSQSIAENPVIHKAHSLLKFRTLACWKRIVNIAKNIFISLVLEIRKTYHSLINRIKKKDSQELTKEQSLKDPHSPADVKSKEQKKDYENEKAAYINQPTPSTFSSSPILQRNQVADIFSKIADLPIPTALYPLIASYVPLEPASTIVSPDRQDTIMLIINTKVNSMVTNVFINPIALWQDTKVSLIEYCEQKFPDNTVLHMLYAQDNFCNPLYNSKTTTETLGNRDRLRVIMRPKTT